MDDTLPEPDRIDGVPHPRHSLILRDQTEAETQFLEAYNTGRLHHAWMITGPKGIGKATLAWKLARFLLAQPIGDGGMFDAPPPPGTLDIDPEHPVARRIASLGEPSLFLCRRPYDDKAKRLKQNITVEEVRKLKSYFNLSATDGGWRVAIIDAADELNTPAANALLKLLEEPPDNVVLILVCHQPSRLLPTIRSRCRQLACRRLTPDGLQTTLSELGFGSDAQSPGIDTLSDGSVGAAVDLLHSNGMSIYQTLVDLVAEAPGLDRSNATKLADKCAARDAAEIYKLTLHLIHILLARLAKHGALQDGTATEAANGEARMLAKLSPDLKSGRKWAVLAAELSARATHARAVNLDPSSVILDMLLQIDKTAQA